MKNSKSANGRIKVLIADDHLIVRAGLGALLGTEGDLDVIGMAKNGVEAVNETVRLQPDVVIMDLMMPKKDGVQAAAEIADRAPSAKIIVLTTYGTSDGISQALRLGAKGAILKNADNTQLATAIRKVAGGGEYVSPEIRQQLAGILGEQRVRTDCHTVVDAELVTGGTEGLQLAVFCVHHRHASSISGISDVM